MLVSVARMGNTKMIASDFDAWAMEWHVKLLILGIALYSKLDEATLGTSKQGKCIHFLKNRLGLVRFVSERTIVSVGFILIAEKLLGEPRSYWCS